MQNVLAFIFASSIGMNVMCALFIAFSKLKNVGRQFAAVLTCCILVSLFQYSSWQYHLSSDLSSSIFWLKLQTGVLFITIIPYFLIFAYWCGVSNIRRYALVLSPFVLLLFSANLFAPHSLRLSSSQIPMVHEFTVFGNETAYRLVGDPGVWLPLYFAFSLCVLVLFVFWLAKSRKKLPHSLWYLLSITILLQIMATVFSILTENKVFETIYLGGLPFTFLNVVCCLGFSNLLLRKTSDLETLSYKTATLERILVSIASKEARASTNDFFASVMLKMQEASGASTGIILVFDGSPANQKVKAVIAVHKQKLLDTFGFSLKAIPEDFRNPRDTHIITSGLMQSYPSTEFYQNIKAQAMISVPMLNQSGDPIGVMSLYFRNPSTPDESFVNIVKVCASRLAAEYSQDLLVKELEDVAYIDFQTKLPNLIKLNKTLAAYERKALQRESSIIAIKFDIDGFAELNRKIGFDGADEVLKVIANRLIDYSTKNNFIARTGGDEFTFVTEDIGVDLNGTIEMHWQALKAMVSRNINTGKGSFRLRCSAGSVVFPSQVPEGMDVMRCVEFALSQAKLKGKNRLQIFDAQMIEKINRQKTIEKELQQEFEPNTTSSMFLVYQPKVNAEGELIGAEALSRWTHPELGVITPLEFIPVAETCGLIDQLGLWCFEEVCKQIALWRDEGFSPKGRLGINVSAQQFDSGNFVENILDILNKYEVDAKQLDLELTESSLMNNIESSINTIKTLREHNFSISLDDFGTGYSSLSYLKDLPLDFLKIDRSFVIDSENETSLHLLKSILSIGKNMKLKTVAEGVEDPHQVDLLKELGCDYYQGYYYSRPLEAADFRKWTFQKN